MPTEKRNNKISSDVFHHGHQNILSLWQMAGTNAVESNSLACFVCGFPLQDQNHLVQRYILLNLHKVSLANVMKCQPFVGRLFADKFQKLFHAILGHTFAEAVFDFRQNNVQFQNAFTFGHEYVAQVSESNGFDVCKKMCER